MSEAGGDEPAELRQQPLRTYRVSRVAMVAIVLVALVAGGLASRSLLAPSQPQNRSPARPIVQIVRQQPGLPSLADVVAATCPSVAVILPNGEQPQSPSGGGSGPGNSPDQLPAFAVSADGWLLTSAKIGDAAGLDVLFGDGRRLPLTDVRSDPVTGLAIAKVDDQQLQPLPLNDQAMARVGDFGVALHTLGAGCSAEVAMIGSDFLADGAAQASYIRTQTGSGNWDTGTPFLGGDGRVVGVASGSSQGALVPAPLAAVLTDELIRNSLSPTTNFGFRAADFSQILSSRLGDPRSSGAGVAWVEAKSAAARAGLKAGDIVETVNGSPVASASELGRSLDAVTGAAKLQVKRGAGELSLTVARS